MQRYKFILEYNGQPFVGWQRQRNGLSIQEVLENAIFSFCQYRSTVHGAGRTDAGVHALAQVAHCDLPYIFPEKKIYRALNSYLKPYPITILDVQSVDTSFHARFSAQERGYLYRIINRKTPLAIESGLAWLIHKPLDTLAMAEAACILVGKHDFSTFTHNQRGSSVRTLDTLTVVRYGELINITTRAHSFLHHQVRNMVGSLRLVGEKRWSSLDLERALLARNRRAGGPTAPAHGLYLTSVLYTRKQNIFSLEVGD